MNEDEFTVRPGPQGVFCAVYDGHGGGEVSAYLKKYLSPIICRAIKLQGATSAVFKRCFAEVTTRLNKHLRKRHIDAGSTALVAWATPKTVLICNTGDCRAVLCRNGLAVPLTKDHKPGLVEEQLRLEKLGGTVVYDRHIKSYRVAGMSVSRSFGDLDRQPFITSVPDTYRHSVRKNDHFIILATDGLWDVLTNQDAVELVLKTAARDNAAALLCRTAVTRHSSDNVTAVVVFF